MSAMGFMSVDSNDTAGHFKLVMLRLSVGFLAIPWLLGIKYLGI